MKLQEIDRTLPLRSFPQEDLNRILLMNFMPWLSKILSLTDERSADRLEIALPAIKDHCISMGFKEIKTMFEMYVDNRLSIKPIPNYFDRILLGKIVADYLSTKKKPKTVKPEMSDTDKQKWNNRAVNKALEYFKLHREVDTTRIYVYDILDDLGYMPTDVEAKRQVKKDAEFILEREMSERKPKSLEEKRNFSRELAEIQTGSSSKTIIKCKELVLAKFLRRLTQDETKLKEFENKFK